MARPDATFVAKMLRELSQHMELEGANHYKARAYARAADNLSLSTVPLDQLILEGRLKEIPGIGDALEAVIAKIYETGRHSGLELMRQTVPAGVLEMLAIPGLKPDRIRKLYTELGISSVAALKEAARTDQLKSLKGYGPNFQAKVLEGIEINRRPQGRHLHRAASAIQYAISDIARTHRDWTNVTVAGDFRRGCELIGDLSLVAVDPKVHGATKVVKYGELTIHLAHPQNYGIALLLATGSHKHLDALIKLAQKRGMTLDQTGLHKKGHTIARATEEGIYEALGLCFIPPELRETGDEIKLAQKGKIPTLVTRDDLHGVLHAHTIESDGAATLQEMAKACRERGYDYLGLTDHSQTAHYAGGLKTHEVAVQQRKIERLNKRSGDGFHIFKGIESDILRDGSLDYADDILETFDLVIASVHSNFRMGRKEQTDRIVRAIENPYTTILGHVTGRQLLRRPGYEVDMERILQACAKQGVAIEINAHPWRLDLDWHWCGLALKLGCIFSIDPDAHSTQEIDNVQWGILMARKGGVPKERVLNGLSLCQFKAHLNARKERQRKLRLRSTKPCLTKQADLG